MPASGGGEAPEELDEKQCLEPIQQHNFKDLLSSCFSCLLLTISFL
jgi:hypothetical protein